MKHNSLIVLFLAVCASLTVGCTATPLTADTWPDAASATTKTGTTPTLQALAALAQPGLNKQAVRTLVGSPHFGEGFFNVTTWHYLFNFNGKQCKMRIDFEDGRSKGVQWQSTDCQLAKN